MGRGAAEAIDVELRVSPDLLLDPAALRAKAAKAARVPLDEVVDIEWKRRSIDARRGRVQVQCRLRLHRSRFAPQPISARDFRVAAGPPRVGVIGAGPAGLFAAWALADAGVPCIVFERGQPVRERRRDLAALTQRGELNPESNYCFGEGGAGTFSDGKLYTRSGKRGDMREVLEALVAYGAPADILVNARPHIGTNRLPKVIGAMREHLASAGVEVCFGQRVDALETRGDEDRRVAAVRLADGRRVELDAVVLATGHSARDVLRFVHAAGATLEPKPFAMGVRIEHAQSFVDDMQYGRWAGHRALGSASYRLVEQVDGRGVFSFCMCPGGFIVPAATEAGGQVVNGWSPASRRGRFANSGFVTEVGPEHLAAAGFDPDDVFAGLSYQRALEARAYQAGGGGFVAPAVRIEDFVQGRATQGELPPCSYPRGLVAADLDGVLADLSAPIREALRRFGEKMPGFAGPDAVAVGVESRTSSPVRLPRDRETLQARGLAGLYPCGEGAGYAGGIMSAALDGIRVARQVARTLGATTPELSEHR